MEEPICQQIDFSFNHENNTENGIDIMNCLTNYNWIEAEEYFHHSNSSSNYYYVPESNHQYHHHDCIPSKHGVPLSLRYDPEYCVARLGLRTNPPPPGQEEESNELNQKPKIKKMTFFEYHKLHPFHIDPSCRDLTSLPISESEFQFLVSEIPDPMWNSTFCIERVQSLLTALLSLSNTSSTAVNLSRGSIKGFEEEGGEDEDVEEIIVIANANAIANNHVDNKSQILCSRILETFKFYQLKSPNGVYIQDALPLAKILLLCRKNIKLQDLFPNCQEIVQECLHKFEQGFRLRRTSDLEYLDGLVAVFNEFGICIRNHNQDFWLSQKLVTLLQHLLDSFDVKDPKCCTTQNQMYKNCKNLATSSTNDKQLDKNLFYQTLQCSELGPRFIQVIIESNNNNNVDDETSSSCLFFINVLGILKKLIESSNEIRLLALHFPIIEPMLLQLKARDPNCVLLSRTVELIYAMLATPIENVQDNNDKIIVAPCSPAAFEVLLFRFLQRLRHVSSKSLIHLRNDVAFVIYLITKNIPILGGYFGRHAYVIAGIISNNILNQQEIPFVLDSTPEDLELLQTLLCTLEMILDVDTIKSEEIVIKYELVSVLVRIIIGPCSILDHLDENEPNLQAIISCSWKLLGIIANKYPLLLLSGEGVDVILNILKIYGNFGRLGSHLLAIFLDIFRTLLLKSNDTSSQGEEEDVIMTYFIKNDATVILTGVLTQLVKDENLSCNSEEPSLANCLLCLSMLTKHDQTQRDIFLQENGIKILTLLLYKLIYNPAHRRHMNPILQIAISECIWKSCSGSVSSLEMFLIYEGIFRLLDLLEIAAGPAPQLHILNTIVELVEYSRATGQLLHWKKHSGKGSTKRDSHSDEFNVPDSNRRGTSTSDGSNLKSELGDTFGDVILDHDQTLSALLCELWRAEETRFGCARDSNGVIASLDHPLMSEYSRYYKQAQKQKDSSTTFMVGQHNVVECNGPSCLDLINSIRPKIYLLVKKIIETTNTEATVFGGLSLPNQITMQIIINFLDLKRGEIWLEMIEELKSENIKLVESDEVAIQRFRNISHNKVATVIDTQRYLIHRAKEHDEIHEREFYDILQQCHFQNHLLALKQADYTSRLSNYFLLLDKRLWQKVQLNQAVKSISSNARIHRTTNDSINVTIWPGRNKIVDSERLFDEPELPTGGGGDKQQQPFKNKGKSKHHVPGSSSATTNNLDNAGAGGSSTINTFGFGTGTGTGRFTHHDDSILEGRLIPTRIHSDSEGSSCTGSVDEGYYTISPLILAKALMVLATEQRKYNWSEQDDDRAWRMRTKWNIDWYP